jgi:hypothetical protein
LRQAFVERHPEIMPMFVSFSLAMALGNIFIYQLQRDYGALVVTTTVSHPHLILIILT